LRRWALPAGLLLALAGYLGAWIAHPAAGLVILGIDLAEYVKFLPEAKSGAVAVWRQWFILPAAALSLSLTLTAANRRLGLHWLAAAVCFFASLVAALTMLPPAWTPALLIAEEFRLQTALLAVCLAGLPLSPLLGRLPLKLLAGASALLSTATAVGAVRQFALIKPAIDRVYGRPPALGWGLFAYLAGSLMILAVSLYIIKTSEVSKTSEV